MRDFNYDDLIKQWKYQDEFEKIAMGLLESGIQLGVQSLGLMMAQYILDTGGFPDTPEELTELMDKANKHAVAELKRRLNNARGA